ncbi:Type 1 glutamine amidotransferase-like domain-containing protein [Microbacterium sp. WCS2018Hpa-9]|uniref:Type 1 glutamine amidotransferase-like domain-containing protein n=1 Tax=Microbacterium sp. WCS2018Hpa-9 TaxID=3073635 RepID=UPI00288BF643|nr:Type 1 glutamine amidotransferase-like domain-containing protein [Microbacterium sp. WCS2018Hpa-9]
MKLLLLSLNPGAMRSFLDPASSGAALRIAYVGDAQDAYADAPFVQAERRAIEVLGHELVDITVRHTTPSDFESTLDGVDAVYVAGGSTFALLESLRVTGSDEVLVRRVRDGLPYIGLSAGAIIVGPDITPASLMDDPHDGPALTDHRGLGLMGQTVIPHADGMLPHYPPALISETVATYGSTHRLLLLRDDQALLIEGDRETMVDSNP